MQEYAIISYRFLYAFYAPTTNPIKENHVLHFLIGAAYSGKTTALYELARQRVSQGRRVLFFVPEQQTAQTEAELIRLTTNRGGEFLEVLNFQRLPNRIFREIGGLALPTVSPLQKSLLIARILREQESEFPLFSKHRKNADFILELSSFLDEVTRSGTDAQTLLSLSGDPLLRTQTALSEKLREASVLAASYEALYRETCGKHPDDTMRLLELLRQGEENTAFLRGATVILDGFYDFTAPQYELICKMAELASEVYLSSLDDGKDGLLFDRPRACRRYLQAKLTEADYDEISPEDLGLAPRAAQGPSDLMFLCDHILTQPDAPFSEKPEHVTLLSCRTPYDEVVAALREVVRLHEEEGVDYADCAVLYRDTLLYGALCRELAAQYGIELYTEAKTPLTESELFLFFSAAAQIACGDRSTAPFLRLLGTGLCPISQKAAFYWKRYIDTWSLSSKQLYTTNDYTASIFGFDEMIRESMVQENSEILSLINREKNRLLSPLKRLRGAFRKSARPRERVDALLTFAEEIGADRIYSRSVNALRAGGEFSAAAEAEGLFSASLEALEGVASSPDETDDHTFLEILRLSFSFGSVGVLPSSPQALAAGDVTFTRLKKVRHLFLIGLCTDVFPSASVERPLLSLRERAFLSRLRDDSPLFFAKPTDEVTREEYFLFYLAASVPRDVLHLSYSTQNLDGSVLRPSVFIQRAKLLFPLLSEEEFCPEKLLPICPAELYDYLVAFRESKDSFTRQARLLFRDGAEIPLPENEQTVREKRDRSRESRETSLTLSQAKLAAYAKCPYAYFLEYKLFLSEPPEARMAASLRGTVVHRVLEHLLYPLSQGRLFKQKLDTLSEEAVESEFEREEKALSDAGYEFDEWDKVWFSDLRRSTQYLVKNIKEELSVGEYRPCFFEADLLRNLTPIERILKNGCRMRISGKADRIDLSTDPKSGKILARVVDYKTGEHTFDPTALYNGLDTQLLLYLFTLSENGIPNVKSKIVPAAAYYLRAHNTPSEAESEHAQKEPFAFTRSGIFLSEEDALCASIAKGVETETKCVPFSYKKDGTPSGSNLMVSEEDMALLKDAVLNYATDTAEDICAGRFERMPLKKEEDSDSSGACEYCPYRAVCRYEDEACRLQKQTDRHTLFDDLRKGGIHRG